MLNNVNLNLLKHFYEVVNTGNITKASENLCVSQPAITKSIKELERVLESKLLHRSKKGVVPTVEGEILYDRVEEIFRDLNKTLYAIEKKKKVECNLFIGATTTNFLEFIQDALNSFKSNHPDVHIDITLEGLNVLRNLSRLDKMDIVIKNDYEEFDDFQEIKSFEISDRFIASKEFFGYLEDKVLSLDDILSLPLVLLSNITHGRRNFDNYLRKHNRQVVPAYEFNSYSLCRQLIRNGFGIGIGNPIHYQNKDFIILKTNFSLPTRYFHIGYNKKSNNEFVKEFINLL